MIWYDVDTGEPVAPGSCEDGGPPSIDGYICPTENRRVETMVLMFGEVVCAECDRVLLIQG